MTNFSGGELVDRYVHVDRTNGGASQSYRFGSDWFRSTRKNRRKKLAFSETLGRSVRKTFLQYLDGKAHQRIVKTHHADGRHEVFIQQRMSNGRVQENLLVQYPDGSWKRTTKTENQRGGLTERTSTSAGRTRIKTVAPRVVAFRRAKMARRLDRTKGQQVIHEYGDGSWKWRATTREDGPEDNRGVVRARGRRGAMVETDSGFISALGTRYGWVRQKTGQARVGRAPLLRRRQMPLSMPEIRHSKQRGANTPQLQREQKRRTQRVYKEVCALIKPLFENKRLNPSRLDFTNTDETAITTGRKISVGNRLLEMGGSCQAVVLAHELRHASDEPIINSPAYMASRTKFDIFADMLCDRKAGTELDMRFNVAVLTARLEFANRTRIQERRADHTAGTVTALGRMLGKRWTPRGQISLWRKVYNPWSPLALHDSVAVRTRTLQRSHNRTLQQAELHELHVKHGRQRPAPRPRW